MVSMLMVPFAFVLPIFSGDPAPSLLRSKAYSRTLDCERLSPQEGAERRPGQIIAAKPRGDFVERSVVVCAERLVRPGVRPPRDEAILAELDARSAEFAAATSGRPDLEDHTWLVEAYYPSAQVSAKISFAAKNALMGQGRSVSDRTPILAADDILVITRMAPKDAYPAACQRYFANGSLGDNDALLAVVSRDPQETMLHAGLCTSGVWTWLK